MLMIILFLLIKFFLSDPNKTRHNDKNETTDNKVIKIFVDEKLKNWNIFSENRRKRNLGHLMNNNGVND